MFKRSKTVFAAVTGLAAATILAACAGGAEPAPSRTFAPAAETPPAPTAEESQNTPEFLSGGAQLYARNCSVCHGDRQGAGAIQGVPSHDETGHTWHHPDAQLKDWVLNGKLGFGQQMPGFNETLTEEHVEAILAFLKTWWTAEQRELQAGVSQRYQDALDKQRSGDE